MVMGQDRAHRDPVDGVERPSDSSPEPLDRTILRLLGDRLSAAQHGSLLRKAEETGAPFEQVLVESGAVTRPELVRLLVEIKGAYGVAVGEEWVEAGLAREVSLEEARALGVLPLARVADRLYLVLPDGDPGEAALERVRARSLTPVPLGRAAAIHPMVDALYEALASYDRHDNRFGQYLIRQGLADEQQIEEGLRTQAQVGWPLGQVVLRMGLLSEPALFRALAAFLDVPYYEVSHLKELLDPAVGRRLPRLFAQRHSVVALRKDARTVWVATSEPKGIEELESIRRAFDATRIHVGVATPTDVRSTILELYGGEEAPLQPEPSPPTAGPRIAGDIPDLVDSLLLGAVRRRASDIHIERYEGHVDVKLRIDGTLLVSDEVRLSLATVTGVVAKVKVDAKLDISERRRPQDGVIRRRFGNRVVDFRVAVQPTIWGENVAIRILDQTQNVPTLEGVGFAPGILAPFRRLLGNPQGLILVTGPTGCGKTTTLYSALQELKRSDVKIVTAEDPVEYAIDGIQQSQVNETIGNTFDCYLRAFLRQDPDVILVGEIRDQVTAEMAIRAALTGHLILATLHVPDALGVIRRLNDLHIEGNLISQTLLCVLSQRLARRVCRRCAERYEPDPALVDEFFPMGTPDDLELVHGRGCPTCHQTGYSGRMALIEFWELDDGARSLIDRNADTRLLREQVSESGMRALLVNAIDKVRTGETTLEELRAVIPYDQIVRYHKQLFRSGLRPEERHAGEQAFLTRSVDPGAVLSDLERTFRTRG